MTLKQIYSNCNIVMGLDIKMNSRKHGCVIGRSIFYKIAVEHTRLSHKAIARFMNRTHATITNSFKNFERDVLGVPEYLKKYEIIKGLVDGINVEKYMNQIDSLNNEINELKGKIFLSETEKEILFTFRELSPKRKDELLLKIRTVRKVANKFDAA